MRGNKGNDGMMGHEAACGAGARHSPAWNGKGNDGMSVARHSLLDGLWNEGNDGMMRHGTACGAGARHSPVLSGKGNDGMMEEQRPGGYPSIKA
jgi:hypothetical protein